jgi:quercetin dioxygenase-like cupin family protein
MSTYASVAGLQPRQIRDGVVARPLHGARITVGILEFEPLTQVPEHRHDNEQMGLVLKGSITMVIDGERRDLQVGGMYSIRSGIPHSGEAGPDGATVPVVPPADELMGRLIDLDHCDRDALIALDARGIAGVARYAALPGQSAYDVAVVVADDWQGKGLGRLLIRRLGHIARLRGISRFHATMFGDNRRALALVRGLSRRATFQYASGKIEADIPLRAHV